MSHLWKLCLVVSIILQQYSVSAQFNVTSTNCSCVAFRLDDIQDWYVREGQLGIMGMFREANLPLTIGLIANMLGTDMELISYIQTALTTSWQLEIANHGYNHEDFTNPNFTSDAQKQLLIDSRDKIFRLTNRTTTTFLPPFNAFEDTTLELLQELGFTHMSSEVDLDRPPYNFINPPVWRFPVGAATSDLDAASPIAFNHVPSTFTFQQIRTQLGESGYAAVMVHPMDFYDWNNDTQAYEALNATKMADLHNLITMVLQAGLRIVPVGSIEKWYGIPVTTGTTGTTGSTGTTGRVTTGVRITPPLTTGVRPAATTGMPRNTQPTAPTRSTTPTANGGTTAPIVTVNKVQDNPASHVLIPISLLLIASLFAFLW